MSTNDKLKIGSIELNSRFIMGSSLYSNNKIMFESLKQSETEFVTVSIRRVSLEQYENSPIEYLNNNYKILPNTAGCMTSKEAILTAQIARESLNTNFIKLELIGDKETLYPDNEELVKTAKILVDDGFQVMPYCSDDLITCKKLEDVGCVAVMPLGSPIGSGIGISNPYNIELINNKINVPVILDAGIGTAYDACLAMELGCDAVLMNSAVAKATNPPLMADAMKNAIKAGRNAFLAKRMPKKKYASPSSPQFGLIG